MARFQQPPTESGVRVCRECKTTKPLLDFGFDAYSNRHLYFCRPCENKRRKIYQRKRSDARTGIAGLKLANRRYYLLNRCKILSRYVDPVKSKARGRLRYAVKAGNLKKPNRCEGCRKKVPLHGHHEDYSKPLIVQWLCSTCHGKLSRS